MVYNGYGGMTMRKILWIAVFLVCCSAALFAQQNLTWSLALIKDNEGVAFSRPVAMKDGESFSIIIHSKQACYAYVIIQDSEKQMMVLLNKRLAANESWQTGSIKLTPPSGSETFHVIMSLTEQPELQEAISAYNKQNDARTTRDLNTALMGVRRSASQFNENPEKPVGMGGAFRGRDPGGTEFSGVGTYVKTIVISH